MEMDGDAAQLPYPTIRFLKECGVLHGLVMTTDKQKLAQSLQRQHPGFVVVHVANAGQQGCFWAMSKEDGERMATAGYPLIDWDSWDDPVTLPLPKP